MKTSVLPELIARKSAFRRKAESRPKAQARVFLRACASMLIVAAACLNSTSARALSPTDELTKVVIPAAEQMCGPFPQHGGNVEGKAKAVAEAGLKGVLGKLANAKLNGSLEGTVGWYSNVLQKDLLSNNKDIRACRTAVINRLLEFIEKVHLQKSRAPATDTLDHNVLGRLKSGTCRNNVYVYRKSNEVMRFTAQELWRCADFGERRIATNKSGLSPGDALLVDKNRGKLSVVEERMDLVWGQSPNRILSLKLKNSGPVSVRIDAIEVLHASLRSMEAWPGAIEVPFVIFPNEEVVIPAVDIAVLAKGVLREYDDRSIDYAVSTESINRCDLPVGTVGSCELLSSGFGIGIKFTDIFGDRYQLNRLAYLISKKTSTGPSMPINNPG